MATAFAWQNESDTKHRQGGPTGEKGLYFAPCPGMPDQCPPQHSNTSCIFSRDARWAASTTGTAGLSSSCRWSDSCVWWQLLERYSKTWSNMGFDPAARGNLALFKNLDEPRQHLVPSFWCEGHCLLKAVYPKRRERPSFAVASHSPSSTRKEKRMEMLGL